MGSPALVLAFRTGNAIVPQEGSKRQEHPAEPAVTGQIFSSATQGNTGRRGLLCNTLNIKVLSQAFV